ncbi:MAG: hypothetical protein A2504_02820 [Bdellovibrionales bacterium RIFOXYD12_FULL_39_22]|nr:MAG: hypothetical protein A2385_05535 [Bdellovibrionales bacterium RIFOXYB1_FULL_39_21]OFZ42218.1 MAG: hypothetical protein A2485_15565 [Bdellovibrionales bacterium RIFOXYC12_FULL_39_17]OFZ46690.1 MAG: hypothetical protein A2404_04105 [Bdellovibrionales bacterium RIFOXYC1_FULL_39_130]OFZ74224.1 MAG: hypothetical protein A2451_02135 [Bdellovibrionales bacterium RIFOXYC2_FULL_39_8]OFZ76033.1 MAG: hypothetical protein A2560_03045 [Bdellovibrionales bacterium RIFOXYD1_FULL_39_84]OFZ93017.1 MAG:
MSIVKELVACGVLVALSGKIFAGSILSPMSVLPALKAQASTPKAPNKCRDFSGKWKKNEAGSNEIIVIEQVGCKTLKTWTLAGEEQLASDVSNFTIGNIHSVGTTSLVDNFAIDASSVYAFNATGDKLQFTMASITSIANTHASMQAQGSMELSDNGEELHYSLKSTIAVIGDIPEVRIDLAYSYTKI